MNPSILQQFCPTELSVLPTLNPSCKATTAPCVWNHLSPGVFSMYFICRGQRGSSRSTEVTDRTYSLQSLVKGLPWWLRWQRIHLQCRRPGSNPLGWEDSAEEEMATHFSIFAWEISWTEEPGGLQSTGLQKVRHDWATFILLFTFEKYPHPPTPLSHIQVNLCFSWWLFDCETLCFSFF